MAEKTCRAIAADDPKLGGLVAEAFEAPPLITMLLSRRVHSSGAKRAADGLGQFGDAAVFG